jgi:hypothetical protein
MGSGIFNLKHPTFARIQKFSIIFLCAVFTSTSFAATEVQAPFGFKWDQKVSDLRAKGFDSTCSDATDLPIRICKFSASPKKFSKADFFQGFFVPGEGLQKVTMLGKDITDDPYGSDGKAQYEALKTSLTKKYGAPTNTYEWEATELYKDSDEFYECLNYQSCGNHTVYWIEGMDGTITLKIKGVSRGKGYIQLIYESPRWSDLLDQLRDQETAGDDDSL